jgi:hypothetical protein
MQENEGQSFYKIDFAGKYEKNSQLKAASCFWVAFNGFRVVVSFFWAVESSVSSSFWVVILFFWAVHIRATHYLIHALPYDEFREVVQILHRLRVNYLSWKRLSIVN